MPFEKAVQAVITGSQQGERNWNPVRPRTRLGRRLFEGVQTQLPPALQQKLRFYCSIGTVLDQHYGADGFFTLGRVAMTVDVTLKEKENFKADILIVRKNLSIVFDEMVKYIASKLTAGYFAPA